MSLPSRLKYGWGFTFTETIKSPAGPPSPEWPFFDTLKLTPLSTPFGMDMVSETDLCCTPLPRHVVQGSLMTVPTPSQLPQTYYIMKGPCLIVWNPAPPHAPHLLALVPGLALLPLHDPQMSVLPNDTCFEVPLIASMKSISIWSRMSLPFCEVA
jgi:hypothetical protein